jgi:peroxidase
MFGQFIDHDFALSAASGSGNSALKCTCSTTNPDCVNIPTPRDDFVDSNQNCMILTRSAASFDKFDCSLGAREQTNLVTHWLDMTQLYGSDSSQQNLLRSFLNGKLKTSTIRSFANKDFLPAASSGTCVDEVNGQFCFESGDSRTSQNMMLVSIHTVWLREHNKIAQQLKQLNPTWTDENLFQETRRILTALYQNIIYSEWLPNLVGQQLYDANELRPLTDGFFLGYDANVNPHLAAEFSTAAFRFGHSMIRSTLSKSDKLLKEISNVTLNDIVLRSGEAFVNGGLDSICRGLLVDPGTSFDTHFTDQLQNHLFESDAAGVQTHHFSLSAINIMRGRDHGLPPYNEFRKFVGLKEAKSFADLTETNAQTRDELAKVYRNVDDIDAYTGGTSEQSLDGALLGPTFSSKNLKGYPKP